MTIVKKIIKFVFGGRINRVEYLLIRFLYTMFCLSIGANFAGDDYNLVMLVVLFYFLGMVCFNIKRLHDIGLPGQLAGFTFVPVLFFTFLLFKKGEPGDNKYGKAR